MEPRKIVVDTNIIIKAFLDMSGDIANVLLYADLVDVILYVPDFISQELYKYQDMLTIKTGYSPEQIKGYATSLFHHIKVFPRYVYQTSYDTLLPHMQSIDPKDIDFVALAHHFNIPLWTNDKALLTKATFIKTYTTPDVIALLG